MHRFAWQADRLLDLACGRGGDIHKWAKAEVRICLHGVLMDSVREHLNNAPFLFALTNNVCVQIKYVKGVDLSPAEIEEAQRRFVAFRSQPSRRPGM